jgi:uncharacterized protein (DUF305 family)
MKSLIAGLLALLSAVLLLSACSGKGPTPPATSTGDKPVITGEPAGFNADDLAFATNILSSHRQSAEMAALVPDRSNDQDLIKLAADLTTSQAPQLEMMKVFLVQWNENPDTNKGQTGHGGVEQGMIDSATVAQLQASTGQEFDDLWLRSMIGHLQGAVNMANAEIEHGANVDAVATAKQIAVNEGARIAQMQPLFAAGQ